MRVIVAGSRGITEKSVVERALDDAWLWMGIRPTTILSGAARGVDQLGERVAAARNVPCTRYPAKWVSLGRMAGFARNIEMAQNADALVAVWDGKSPGTKHMVAEAHKRGLLVYVHEV